MAKQDIASAVADALIQMGVESVVIDRSHRHPRVLWADRISSMAPGRGPIRGIITVPSTASDRRSLVNNVTMARRLVRQARGE